MASCGSDRNAKYALSKLLQMDTVAEYESEFVILTNRVTGISANLLKSPFEDESPTTTNANPNDLNKARPDQVLEESTSHTSDKVEVVSISMVATYEEHGCQDGFCMVATYEEHGCQDGLKHVTTTSVAGKKGDLSAISSKGGPPDHMQASEKELDVLKSPLKEKSMFEESVKNRFGLSKYEDPKGALSKLLQLETVEDYQGEFEKLMNQRELLASKPLTLGYVFLLARMIEACLEDNRSTATIAKPNDL
ncbi:hypothetical protein Tco_1544115, partial [Tanacetum coccineum]